MLVINIKSISCCYSRVSLSVQREPKKKKEERKTLPFLLLFFLSFILLFFWPAFRFSHLIFPFLCVALDISSPSDEEEEEFRYCCFTTKPRNELSKIYGNWVVKLDFYSLHLYLLLDKHTICRIGVFEYICGYPYFSQFDPF